MNPAGSYRLASVNGRDIPAVWHEVTSSSGEVIHSVWVDGRVTFHPEGAFQITLQGALLVDGRTDPLGSIATCGEWHPAGEGAIALRSDQGAEGHWEASSDLSVLVARSKDRSARTIFVFHKD